MFIEEVATGFVLCTGNKRVNSCMYGKLIIVALDKADGAWRFDEPF